MDKVKLYKLIGGQEIIGTVVEEGFNWVVLQNVLTFRVVPSGPGQYGLDLSPHSPTLPDAKWKYYLSQVMAEPLEVPDGLIKAYMQQVSGIEIVSSLESISK